MKPSRYPVWAAAILLTAIACRVFNLRKLPPFIDESGHIYASVHYDFYPLLDRLRSGKVFGYFVFYPAAALTADPLLATRLLVACLGVLTTLGVFVLTRRIAGEIAAVFAGALWALMPYAVFHERMALHDPIVCTCVIWAMVACVRAIDGKSIVDASLCGLLLAAAILTKVTAGVAVLWVLLLAAARLDWRSPRQRLPQLGAFLIALTVPCSAMVVAFAKTGVGNGAQFINTEPASAAHTLWRNLATAVRWTNGYNSAAFMWIAIGVIASALIRPSRMKLALLFSWLIALFVQAMLFKEWFPRYLLPSLLVLIILIAVVGSEWIEIARQAWKRRYSQPSDWIPLGTTLLLILFLVDTGYAWVKSDIEASVDPMLVRMPAEDRFQYLTGWPSATGLDRVLAYLNQQAAQAVQHRILVLAGPFGRHGWWSLPLVGTMSPGIVLRSDYITSRRALIDMAAEIDKQPTFVLFEPPAYNQPPDLLTLSPKPKLVFEYKRPQAEGGFQLFAIGASSGVSLTQEQEKTLESGMPVLADIYNRNDIETVDGQPFMWLGNGDTVLQILSKGNGEAELQANFFPGPSVPGRPERHLVIDTGDGRRDTLLIGTGPRSLKVRLRAGKNRVLLSCVEKSSGRPVNGDARPLVLGVRGLHIAAFHPGR